MHVTSPSTRVKPFRLVFPIIIIIHHHFHPPIAVVFASDPTTEVQLGLATIGAYDAELPKLRSSERAAAEPTCDVGEERAR